MTSHGVERITLVGTTVLAVVLLGFMLWERDLAAALDRELAGSEEQLAQLGRVASDTLVLRHEKKRDGVSNHGPFDYIGRQMTGSRIGKRFDIGKTTRRLASSGGYEDEDFNLKPSLRNYSFTRREISNFLLYTEGKTHRMKVTKIRLERSTARDARNDSWRPTFTITDRRPVGAF